MRASAQWGLLVLLSIVAYQFLSSLITNWKTQKDRRLAILDAAKTALREMIVLIGERLGLSPEDAYMFCSLAVDMRVTQLVDGNKGIHAMLPKRYANGRPNA